MDSFSCAPLILFIYLFIYLFKNKFPEVPEYAKTLLDVLGKRAWVIPRVNSQISLSGVQE